MEIERSRTDNAFSDAYKQRLRAKIMNNLEELGFVRLDDGDLSLPDDKDYIRKANAKAVKIAVSKKSELIRRKDEIFTENYIIDGVDREVKSIWPKLVPVTKQNNDLFNWVKLHWSIPISAGYGRRLRYLVIDENNGAVIGIIGLADPVFGLKDRDNMIGWKPAIRKERLKHLMDAFVLGSVPPYSFLLGGKLVASMLTSPTVRHDFKEKYKGKRSLISGEVFNGKLAAITTASALGKSSIYDRIKIKRGAEFVHTGWSKGSGEFHLFSDVYPELTELVRERVLKRKNPLWGTGIRNRRVVLREALHTLGLSEKLLYHNIKRELFIVPLGKNAFSFLQGQTNGVGYYQLSHDEIARKALKRWVFKRYKWDTRYLDFKKETYSLKRYIE